MRSHCGASLVLTNHTAFVNVGVGHDTVTLYIFSQVDHIFHADECTVVELVQKRFKSRRCRSQADDEVPMKVIAKLLLYLP